MTGLNEFIVVHFIESATVEAVPRKWLQEKNGTKTCFFPPKGFDVTRLVNSRSDPSSTWEIFPVRKWKGSFSKL